MGAAGVTMGSRVLLEPSGSAGGDVRQRRQRPQGPGVSDAEAEAWRRRLHGAVRRFCPPWLRSQTEDIAQAAFLQVLRIRRRGQPITGAYLDRVAYGFTVDAMRRRRRRQEGDADPEPALAAAPTRQPSPESGAQAGQLGRALRQCLEALLESRRRAVALYLLGHSVPEIGRGMGWSTKKSESLVYRGLANLRRCLEAKGWTP